MTNRAPTTARLTTRRWFRLATICATTAVVAVAGTAAASAAPGTTLWGAHVRHAATPHTVAPVGAAVHYAIDKPVCDKPSKPDLASCFALRRVQVAKGTPGAFRYTTPAYQVGPAGGYTPADLAAAYKFKPTIKRSSNIVGIVDWYDDPHVLADLNHFDATYGFPRETARSFAKLNQAGHTSPLPRPDMGTSGEIALDVETVRAVCHTCRILLIEAKSPTDGNLATAENLAARLGASEISNSYGGAEHKVSAAVANAYNHPGVVITVSTGDSGWYGWDVANGNSKGPGVPMFPATSPYVVSVGGTGLTLNSNGTRQSEYVWNENGADDQVGIVHGTQGAAGGGCSTRFAAPPWQLHHTGYPAAGCKGKRLAADVSALADPQTGFDVYDSFVKSGESAWATIGGTSLAAPLVAAMYALAGGAGDSAYPAASLYTNSTARPAKLFDVQTGGNGFCGGDTDLNCANATLNYSNNKTNNPNGLGGGIVDCSFPHSGASVSSDPGFSSECNAVKGYDGASGVGSPASLGLFAPTTAALAIHASHATTKHATSFAAQVRQRVANTHAVQFYWSFGDGKRATSTSAGIKHTYAHAGKYVVSLVEVDSRYQFAITAARVTVSG